MGKSDTYNQSGLSGRRVGLGVRASRLTLLGVMLLPSPMLSVPRARREPTGLQSTVGAERAQRLSSVGETK
jgi:hypothetical protein